MLPSIPAGTTSHTYDNVRLCPHTHRHTRTEVPLNTDLTKYAARHGSDSLRLGLKECKDKMYALMSQFTRFARQQHRFAKVSKQARLIGRNEKPIMYYKHWKIFGTESNTLTAFSSLDKNKPLRFFHLVSSAYSIHGTESAAPKRLRLSCGKDSLVPAGHTAR